MAINESHEVIFFIIVIIYRNGGIIIMKSYIVEFQVEKQGSTKQQTIVQAANRAEARAKVLSRHSFHKIRIIAVIER